MRALVVGLVMAPLAWWGAVSFWESGFAFWRSFTTPAPDARVEDPGMAAPVPEVGAAAPESLAGVTVTWRQVARGVLPVTGALNALTGEVWIGEQGGTIRPLDPDSADGLGAPVLDLSDRTEAAGERGLLGMAFSPAADLLYVHYSDGRGDTEIVEFDVAAIEAGSPGDGRVVLEVGQPRRNHNGGEIVFGPDGYLYIALGDGGGAGDGQGNAQNVDNLLGAVLRIDPFGPFGDEPYAVPETNPFAAAIDGSRPEIWAFGLRNPFRMSFDADGSLWIGDVGQRRFEEITRIPFGVAGANLGWNLVEGDAGFEGSADGLDGYVGPVHVYSHGAERCSVTGGRVYRGQAIAGLAGAYLYGDFCDGFVRTFAAADPATDRVLGERLPSGPTAFVETADGEVIVLTHGGPILALEPAT